jgi:hypothetical protein
VKGHLGESLKFERSSNAHHRHCEQSEAIDRSASKTGFASSQALLAMTIAEASVLFAKKNPPEFSPADRYCRVIYG